MPHLKEVASQQGGRLQTKPDGILGKCQRDERKKPFFWSGEGSPSLGGGGAAAQHIESQVVKDRGSGVPQTTGLGFLLKSLRWVDLRRRPAQMLPGCVCNRVLHWSTTPASRQKRRPSCTRGLGLDHLMGPQGQPPSCPEFSARSTPESSYLGSSKDILDLPGVGGAPAHKDCTNSAVIGYFALFPD